MRKALSIALIAVGFGGAFLSFWVSTVNAQAPHGVVVEIDEPIQPSTASFLERVVNEAEDGGARFVVIRLDTPGGLYDSTRDIVETILESEIPVIVYVSPSGAQAASAGTFIATAGHITAMANGTNIGAASPVDQRGGPLPEPLGSKATNDAAAFLRSIAVERERNADALNDTVTKALAYSASEALNRDVIDFVAKDLDQLLSTVDGTSVDLFDGSSYVLDTSGVDLRTVDKTVLERFLAIISNPNVAFLLLVIGAIGLFIEFMAPGLFAPGIVGVLCLVTAFVALGNLPVNWVGLALLAFALVLIFAELKSPGVSFFGAGRSRELRSWLGPSLRRVHAGAYRRAELQGQLLAYRWYHGGDVGVPPLRRARYPHGAEDRGTACDEGNHDRRSGRHNGRGKRRACALGNGLCRR